MSDEKKIIIDEDWKSQVEAQREEARRKAEAGESASAKGGTQRKEAGSRETVPTQRMEPPPATFDVHVTSLGAQALMYLGQFPNPMTQKYEVQLPEARHFIDLMAMLEEKTRGNLTPDESRMLNDLLHEIRMAYVAVENSPKPA